MKEHIIHIDKEKCIGCGLCRKDCPADNITLTAGKAAVKSQTCIKCGHCTAICPPGAVSMTGFDEPPEPFDEKTVLDPRQLLAALKTRRSIRQFKQQPVPPQTIAQIIEAGRFSPTAKNAQDLSYLVLSSQIRTYEAIAVRFFQKLLPMAKLVLPMARNVTVDHDFFFKNAPAAVVILSKDQVSGALAASNMALMAESCGLGVLYSGFFTIAANRSKALRKALGLKQERAVTTLVLGYPNVTYRRTAQKETAAVRYL